jgi:hypothetical protein
LVCLLTLTNAVNDHLERTATLMKHASKQQPGCIPCLARCLLTLYAMLLSACHAPLPVAVAGGVPGTLQFTLPGGTPPYTAAGGTCAFAAAPSQPTAACLRFSMRAGYARRTYQALNVTQVRVSARGGRVVVQVAGFARPWPPAGRDNEAAAYNLWTAMDGGRFKQGRYPVTTGVISSTSTGGWVSMRLEGVTGKREVRPVVQR